MPLEASGNDRLTKVHIHLTIPKQRTFHVSLSGIGLNCSPTGGIFMSTISSSGDSIRCKTLVSSREDGLVICLYECKCPDVCSIAVAYISDTATMYLCKIVDWHVSTTVALRSAAMIPVKYKRDIIHVTSVLIILNNWENKGTEYIGLVTPTPGRDGFSHYPFTVETVDTSHIFPLDIRSYSSFETLKN